MVLFGQTTSSTLGPLGRPVFSSPLHSAIFIAANFLVPYSEWQKLSVFEKPPCMTLIIFTRSSLRPTPGHDGPVHERAQYVSHSASSPSASASLSLSKTTRGELSLEPGAWSWSWSWYPDQAMSWSLVPYHGRAQSSRLTARRVVPRKLETGGKCERVVQDTRL